MPHSKNYIPRKGVNPQHLKNALDRKNEAFINAQQAVNKLSKMVIENSRIIGQLVIMFEVLKDKGIITNDEINNKFKQLSEEREAAAKEKLEAERKILADQSLGRDTEPNKDSENPEGSSIQSKEAGNPESNK
jgi:hypothetical protein